MNLFRKCLIAVAMTAGAAAAFAQEATPAPEFDHFAPAKSRAEVRAETAASARLGQIGRTELDSQRVARDSFVALKTRGQVQAETAEARRIGLTMHGEAGAPAATPEQLESVRQAGLRVLGESFAQRR